MWVKSVVVLLAWLACGQHVYAAATLDEGICSSLSQSAQHTCSGSKDRPRCLPALHGLRRLCSMVVQPADLAPLPPPLLLLLPRLTWHCCAPPCCRRPSTAALTACTATPTWRSTTGASTSTCPPPAPSCSGTSPCRQAAAAEWVPASACLCRHQLSAWSAGRAGGAGVLGNRQACAASWGRLSRAGQE